MRSMMSRRARLAVLPAALGVLLAGCGASEGDGAERAPAAVGGEFAGTIDGATELISVSAEQPDADGKRKIEAYLCGGNKGAVEWFSGTADGNAVDLRSRSGTARLRLTLADDAAKGTATLAGGRTLKLDVPRATPGSGLFNVVLAKDGSGRGIAANGATLVTSPPKSTGRVDGKITAKSGEAVPFTLKTSTPGESRPDAYWAIAVVGDAGDVRFVGKAVDSTSTNWVLREPWF